MCTRKVVFVLSLRVMVFVSDSCAESNIFVTELIKTVNIQYDESAIDAKREIVFTFWFGITYYYITVNGYRSIFFINCICCRLSCT